MEKEFSPDPIPFPSLLSLARPPLSFFPLAFPYRRGVEASFNVVCSPRRSDPVEAMRDSIRPNNAIWHRLDPFLASSSAMRGLDPSIYIQCQSRTTSDPSRYSISEGSVRPWTTCDPSLNTYTAREVRSACPYILKKGIRRRPTLLSILILQRETRSVVCTTTNNAIDGKWIIFLVLHRRSWAKWIASSNASPLYLPWLWRKPRRVSTEQEKIYHFLC